VSIDVIERRRAIEQRLARARTVAHSVEEATADIATSSGQPIEDLDPNGSLRTALTALAGVASLRPDFDVLLALPDAPFALRVRHTDDDVDIEILHQLDDETWPANDAGAEPSPPETDLGLDLETDLETDPESESEPDPESDQPENPQGQDEGHVASDLAAMLWQNVAPGPSTTD
jgi:hypothetical protein